ncbi:MAG: hypothetical protein A2W03_06070 [Candidatus Aminicenantes bacterium RBG_16_63_16]|nr:MAG: hypothetical protein A2W03_06070 [Candidatus Aminicenantes bacterium RBG_16_63_16]
MSGIAVKICGLTNAEDALFALEQGADYLGFVLYRGSPRGLAPDALEALRGRLPAGCRCVGVFVGAPQAEVIRVATQCRLHAVQIHGDEDASEFKDCPVPLWRAVRFVEGRWRPDPVGWVAARWVIDAPAQAYGGSGRLADWAAAAEFARGHSAMLAGGLNAGNVAGAIRAVAPAGVDVSSGVEREPGRKDPAKVRAFIAAARGAQ